MTYDELQNRYDHAVSDLKTLEIRTARLAAALMAHRPLIRAAHVFAAHADPLIEINLLTSADPIERMLGELAKVATWHYVESSVLPKSPEWIAKDELRREAERNAANVTPSG